MKVKFLGQAGLLFEKDDIKILVDPYLSNSVERINPKNYRRQPIDETLLEIKPNVIVITHNHLDHLDPDTLKHYFHEESNILCLAPFSSWNELRKFQGNNNYVMFNNGTTLTYKNIKFRAVKAEHSDLDAIGVIIYDEDKTHYITGDTLYSEKVFESLPMDPINYLYLPINGVGNNMNIADAICFAKRINADKVIPIHFGMFDETNPFDLTLSNKIIPEIYKDIF